MLDKNLIKIKDFLKKEDNKNKPKIIVIFAPTWAWKTEMSIEIAKYLNTEIISTDSRQIYKYLNIWTWKITEEEKQWIKHHMLDFLDINKKYSVWLFQKEANKIINNLLKNNKIPILCWWTWLYINSILYDYKVSNIKLNKKLRKELNKLKLEKWNKAVWEELNKIDPEYAKELHFNNIPYIERAIEVKLATWISKKDLKQDKILKYNVLYLSPEIISREKLYNKINKRVLQMFDCWLVEEVKNILNMWYKKDCYWLKSIWYKEIIKYLDWEYNLERAIELVQQHNRNYAKKQFTWWRKNF